MSKIVPRVNIFKNLPYTPLCMENFAKLVLIPCKLCFYKTKSFTSLCLTNISLFKLPNSDFSLCKGLIACKRHFDSN